MGEYPPILDLNRLKQEMNLTDKQIQNSGFSGAELQTIYADYLKRLEHLISLKNQFVSKYIVSAKGVHLHSYNGRVKEPLHLIEKIIRKRSNNYRKYQDMTTSDYYQYVTDIIGCRILLIYKEDWQSVHDYLTSQFLNDPSKYIDPNHYAASYVTTEQPPFMAECPVAHMRLGDEDIYPETVFKVERDRYYRSLHYIIRYEKYYVEIQVRTLFEEAWGEVDHDVLYPYYINDAVLVDFSKLLNRAAGMGDEMSAYFKSKLSRDRPYQPNKLQDVPCATVRPVGKPSRISSKNPIVLPQDTPSPTPDTSTAQDVMKKFLDRDEV